MASSNSARLVAATARGGRAILTLTENSNGDLTLFPRGGDQHRAHGTTIESQSSDPNHGRRIIQQHYSIHTSPSSPSGINTIKHSQVFEGGEITSVVQNTLAIKQNNEFTAVYAQRVSDMAGPQFDIKGKDGRFVWLGPVEIPFSLIYGVFVGPPDRRFKAARRPDLRFHQLKFTQFSLVFLWSFLSIPAIGGSGQVVRVFTDPTITGFSQGGNEHWVFQIFDEWRQGIRSEYIRYVAGLSPLAAWRIQSVAPVSQYFAEGTPNTRRFQSYLRAIRAMP